MTLPMVFGRTILSLCDYSGNWAQPYIDAGYDVRLIDLKHGEDVRLYTHPGRVHGILAAPPCTVFAGSGARWPRTDGDYREGLAVVDACLRLVVATRPQWWCLENPIGKLNWWLGSPKMYFDPCDYGDPYTKRTALWGEFTIPVRNPVAPTEGSKMHTGYGGKSERTKELRALTPPGFARAFFQANP